MQVNANSIAQHLFCVQSRFKFTQRLTVQRKVRQLAKHVKVMNGMQFVTDGGWYVAKAFG
jgi:hypothetical protein